MTKPLESFYLMNVALYLEVQDFLPFITINSKCTDLFFHLHINPYKSSKIDPTAKQFFLKILSHIETLNLDISYLQKVSEETVNFQKIKYLRLYKTNPYYFMSGTSKLITQKIERTPARQGELDFILKHPEDFISVKSIIVDDFFVVNDALSGILKLPNLKNIVIYVINDVNFKRLDDIVVKLSLKVDFVFFVPSHILRKLGANNSFTRRIKLFCNDIGGTEFGAQIISKDKEVIYNTNESNLTISDAVALAAKSLPRSLEIRAGDKTSGIFKVYDVRSLVELQKLVLKYFGKGDRLVFDTLDALFLDTTGIEIQCISLRSLYVSNVADYKFKFDGDIKTLDVRSCKRVDFSNLVIKNELNVIEGADCIFTVLDDNTKVRKSSLCSIKKKDGSFYVVKTES
ncbi:hypothetical protein EIN_306700 [Entamoeba invadens IP1]|uniref:Uncharacterized protein n=1 Tax=Entamoeba invadens IP1 TaxID=370355 RepID=A0A0A1TYY8_ENTIV|nr:hypothetical protein EIN_306700 [Entamoeba invadens IP1]ELP86724.1 hypothetical protein EIN_306700 [Entamoeba invadens IP1]|eukprot:XP_004186070.1 hypothetical protein EIN_306700 [Entamoeba invadens IP1]